MQFCRRSYYWISKRHLIIASCFCAMLHEFTDFLLYEDAVYSVIRLIIHFVRRLCGAINVD